MVNRYHPLKWPQAVTRLPSLLQKVVLQYSLFSSELVVAEMRNISFWSHGPHARQSTSLSRIIARLLYICNITVFSQTFPSKPADRFSHFYSFRCYILQRKIKYMYSLESDKEKFLCWYTARTILSNPLAVDVARRILHLLWREYAAYALSQ